ncbi:M20 aminoacylase family protein [Nitratireductor basaltis]|uniref:Amidohydrolase n=1 Tax=Nitratireductor basaltis TaxID=472175 RepID=A0A084U575_9HYPH|nr:M20 aminoacylase family protein [Nitratireductor basaltis]KFB08111.1 Amidohydrolase [Nitratireductor basaltis]
MDLAPIVNDARQWRRHLHQMPELQFVEHKTADFVAEKLASFGLEVHRGMGGTGVVAVIDGKGPGKNIALRCELDALPIEEQTNVEYSSRNEGAMHACGHDGHMSMLLGAARSLSENRDFGGTVTVIFQPAEEFGGGGNKMIEDGLFEKFPVDEVYAIHNMPGVKAGQVAALAGPVMAAARSWDLIIRGKGAHAGWPHTGIDGIAIAHDFTSGCNTIVARETDPVEAVVISPTQIHAGTNYNVVPEVVKVGGTIRTLSNESMAMVMDKMRQLAKGLAIAKGCEIELDIHEGYPVTVNHAAQVDAALQIARDTFGADAVDEEVAPKMGTEDFSYMLAKKPGAYIFLGSGDTAPLHNPKYDFNDDILERGIGLLASLARKRTAA